MIRALSLLVLVFVCPLTLAATETHVGQVSITANDGQLKNFIEGSEFQRRKVSQMPSDLRAEMAFRFSGNIHLNDYDMETITWAYKAVPLVISVELLDGRKYSSFLGYMYAGYLYKEGESAEEQEAATEFQKKSEQELLAKLRKYFSPELLSNQFVFSRHKYGFEPKVFGYMQSRSVDGLGKLQAPILSQRLELQNMNRMVLWKVDERLHEAQYAEIPVVQHGQQALVTLKSEGEDIWGLESLQVVMPESLLLNVKHEIDLLQTASWALVARNAPSVDETTYIAKLSQVIQRLHHDLTFYKKDKRRTMRMLGQAQQLKGMMALLQSPHSQANSAGLTGNLGIIAVLKGKKRGKTMTFQDAIAELDQDLNKVMFEALGRLPYKCELLMVSAEYKETF